MEDATATIVSSIEIFESNFEMNEPNEEESVAEVMESCKEMDERNGEEALVVTLKSWPELALTYVFGASITS